MSVPTLLTKSWIEANLLELSLWQQHAYRNFVEMVADKENTYPCVPARLGFLADSLRFGFVDDARTEHASAHLASLLQQYGECSRETGPYASLVVLFDTPEDSVGRSTVEQYEELFWSLLSRVSSHDTKDWPDHIAKDPAQPSWEFCFDGEPYFAFCATPAHVLRRSRWFSHFILAFQPRWVFESINASTPLGNSLKKAIRKRLADYDEIPIHSSLQWYGQEGNLEWKQYFLRDQDELPSKCPFSYMKNLFKKIRS
ncbi:YqcI/YcgG family protein [Paenibacillus agilis]|uniref:YqcI/YcgG family protein n=1 Tax=Paenibacillus agilis TaxID=3020863 RepID=A0A559IPX0_9BACL|nr:YqcI/YcgG family protein [Paenibacillus agilis]TVX89656.1 YqcI/YcgG family protein [Paenibacillus agilis]